MAILVTGGAGYIGSHTVKYLMEKNEEVIVVDNLQNGHQSAITSTKFFKVDIRDKDKLRQVFQDNDINSVIHFAANSLVGESMEKPLEYFHNNVYGTMCLLETMMEYNVKNIIFSSTAATYGEPTKIPITESYETNPTNAYGESKLMIEKLMKWFDYSYGIKYVSLRYFNASGADPGGAIGEDHEPETHLIPLLLQVPLGKREKVYIFGDDYDTPDGTCIRDYIHVNDLASAHYLSYLYLKEGMNSEIFNLGYGNGYSVLEILNTCRKITGHSIPSEVKERRSGDPAVLIASSEKARRLLNWQPKYTSLERIIGDAWNWHKKNPEGYN
jgi:UDP-glucose 4-epimerase